MSPQAHRPDISWCVQDRPGLDMLVAEAVVSKQWEMRLQKKSWPDRESRGSPQDVGLTARLERNREF